MPARERPRPEGPAPERSLPLHRAGGLAVSEQSSDVGQRLPWGGGAVPGEVPRLEDRLVRSWTPSSRRGKADAERSETGQGQHKQIAHGETGGDRENPGGHNVARDLPANVARAVDHADAENGARDSVGGRDRNAKTGRDLDHRPG